MADREGLPWWGMRLCSPPGDPGDVGVGWLRVAGGLAEQVRPAPGADLSRADLRLTRQPSGPVRLEATLVRREVMPDGAVVLHQAVGLIDDDGARTGAGELAWRAATTLPEDRAEAHRRCDIGTVPWGRALADRLGRLDGFADTTRAFDGTIGLGAGDREVQLRLYRGRVLEAVRKTVEGATFAVAGSDRAWCGFLLAGRDDFVRRTSEGEFNATGSSFQYLRMFKAVAMIAVEAKRMWEGESRALL